MRRAIALKSEPAPYYPPRARWYGKLRYPWFAVRREMQLEVIEQRAGMSVINIVLGFVLPGLSYAACGRRITAGAVGVSWGIATVAFMVAADHSFANIARMAAMSLHATSVLYLLGRLMPQAGVGERFMLGLATIFTLSQFVYVGRA